MECRKIQDVILLWFCLIIQLIYLGSCDEIKRQIYSSIQSNYTCFRRFNATHQTGCSSERLGNTGTAFLITSSLDLEWLRSNGTQHPYILLLEPPVFELIMSLLAQESSKFTGVVLLSSKKFVPDVSYSPEGKCPNKLYDLYANSSQVYHDYCDNNPWNLHGSNLLMMDWKFPILLVQNDTDIDALYKCFDGFNKPDRGVERPYPLCGIEINALMYGAKDTRTCMRRSAQMKSLIETQYCDPLGGYNIYYPVNVIEQNDSVPAKSLTVVCARLDSSSMFEGISPGGDSAISGVVALLLTAHLISKFADLIKDTNENVVFLLFNGESFDYIGSSRVVSDLTHGQFPFEFSADVSTQPGVLNLTHIKRWVEISQVHQYEENGSYFIHSDPLSKQNDDVNKEVERMSIKFQNVSKKFNLKFESTSADTPLLPSSLHSLLRAEMSVPGLVIANHGKTYTNRFYHSVYDDIKNINFLKNKEKVASEIIKFSQAISETILWMLLKSDVAVADIATDLVVDILDCYLISPQCSYWKSLIAPELFDTLPYNPLSTYVSVYHGRGPSHYVYLTHHTLSVLTGTANNMTNKECRTETLTQSIQYIWLNDSSTCIATSAIFTPALSPAFDGNYYNDSLSMFSSWTESVWIVPHMQIYLFPSRQQNIMTLVCGVVVTLVSLIVVAMISFRSHILFSNQISPEKEEEPTTINI